MDALPRIGFIGQGFVGKSYADDFENRGYEVVRYSLEDEYIGNAKYLVECDIIFIAVPTPTTPQGFDDSILLNVLSLPRPGTTVVIKSTVLPGTTDALQQIHPELRLLFSPEFLLEATAGKDAAEPIMNIVGVPENAAAEHLAQAEAVLRHLPPSPHRQIMNAKEAELFKYIHNIHGFMRVIFANLLFDLSQSLGTRWEELKKAMDADPMMSPWYNSPVHKSGRGAGGHCFIKDFAAFRQFFEKKISDPCAADILRAMEQKNVSLLLSSNKDLHLLTGVYGDAITNGCESRTGDASSKEQ